MRGREPLREGRREGKEELKGTWVREAEKRRTRRKRAESREFGPVDTSLVMCKLVGGYSPLLGTVKLRVSVFTSPCCERIHEGESVPKPVDSGVRTCKKDASRTRMETFA